MMITNPRLFVLQIRNNHVLIEIEFLFFPSIVHTALLSCLSQFNHDCYFSSIHPLAGSNYVRLLLDLPKFPISSQLVSSVIQDGPHFAVDSYLSREKFHHTRHVFFCLLLPLSRSFIRKRKSSDEPIVFVCVCVRFRRRPRFENIYIYIESPSLLPFLLYIVCACFRSFPCPAGYVRKKKKKLFHHDKSRNQGIKNISWVSCDGLNCPDMIVCREKKGDEEKKKKRKWGVIWIRFLRASLFFILMKRKLVVLADHVFVLPLYVNRFQCEMYHHSPSCCFDDPRRIQNSKMMENDRVLFFVFACCCSAIFDWRCFAQRAPPRLSVIDKWWLRVRN